MNIQDLYKLFEDNNLSPTGSFVQPEQPQNGGSFIKIGDIVVAQFKNREIRGEVFRIFEKVGVEHYDVKVGTTIISVNVNNIIEHYPKNTKFETIKKENIKEIQPEEIIQEDKKIDIPLQTQIRPAAKPVQQPVVKPEPKPIPVVIVEENKNVAKDKLKDIESQVGTGEGEPKKVIPNPKRIEKEDEEKNPDKTSFKTNETVKETVKVIGRITHFTGNLKIQEVIDFLAKKGIDKEKCWYFITEKNGEIHLIRNNEKGFQMQPFVISFVDLKIKDKLNESKEQIKIVGNNHFSIISNIPQSVYDTIKNGLITLLSQTKK